MTVVADLYEHVVGVDTHARTHTYAVIETGTGRTRDTSTFPTTPAGLNRAVGWIQRRTGGPVLVAVEGTGSYGANVARNLQAAGIPVCDVRPPKRDVHAGKGKSDEIDAVAAARTAPVSGTTHLAAPRADGIRLALRVLLVGRRAMDSRCTADRNALTALLRGFDLGVDVRGPVKDAQISAVAAWRSRSADDAAAATIRAEARRLASSVLELTRQLKDNRAALAEHVEELAPGLLDVYGLGQLTAATVLVVYSHKGRLRSEAAFAALAGAAPLQASSGNTVRHRLNHHGDRQLNQALDVIAKVRSVCDGTTGAYIERRLAEGKSRREIRRCLKRYIARQLFRHLNSIMA